MRSGQHTTSTFLPRSANRRATALGRAGIDRRAHDDKRAVADMRRDLLHDRGVEDRHRRVQELVDGRADDDDDRLGAPREERWRLGWSGVRRSVGRTRARSSSAPVSRKGISPIEMRSSVSSLVSTMATRNPSSASARDKRQSNVATAADHGDVEVR